MDRLQWWFLFGLFSLSKNGRLKKYVVIPFFTLGEKDDFFMHFDFK